MTSPKFPVINLGLFMAECQEEKKIFSLKSLYPSTNFQRKNKINNVIISGKGINFNC